MSMMQGSIPSTVRSRTLSAVYTKHYIVTCKALNDLNKKRPSTMYVRELFSPACSANCATKTSIRGIPWPAASSYEASEWLSPLFLAAVMHAIHQLVDSFRCPLLYCCSLLPLMIVIGGLRRTKLNQNQNLVRNYLVEYCRDSCVACCLRKRAPALLLTNNKGIADHSLNLLTTLQGGGGGRCVPAACWEDTHACPAVSGFEPAATRSRPDRPNGPLSHLLDDKGVICLRRRVSRHQHPVREPYHPQEGNSPRHCLCPSQGTGSSSRNALLCLRVLCRLMIGNTTALAAEDLAGYSLQVLGRECALVDNNGVVLYALLLWLETARGSKVWMVRRSWCQTVRGTWDTTDKFEHLRWGGGRKFILHPPQICMHMIRKSVRLDPWSKSALNQYVSACCCWLVSSKIIVGGTLIPHEANSTKPDACAGCRPDHHLTKNEKFENEN